MTAINFPDPDGQTPKDTFGPKTTPAATSNGVTYIWTNGTWSISGVASPNFITQEGADSLYVNVDGDNMTGPLTLGTDKITLDADAGFGNFDGNVNVGNDITLDAATGNATFGGAVEAENCGIDAALTVNKEGLLTASNPVFASKNIGATDNSIEFFSDGSAIFAGAAGYPAGRISVKNSNYLAGTGNGAGIEFYNINQDNNGPNWATIYIDGTKAFAQAGSLMFRVKGENIDDSQQVDVCGVRRGAFEVFDTDNPWNGNNRRVNIRLNTNGSADFGGKINVTGTVEAWGHALDLTEFSSYGNIGKGAIQIGSSNDSSVSGAGGAKAYKFVIKEGGNDQGHDLELFSYKRNASDPFKMVRFQGNNGDLYVAGSVTATNVTFNVEPDNPDNYTTTTEAYEIDEEVTPYVPAVPATYDEYGNELTAEVPAVEATYQRVTKTREVTNYTGPTLDVKDRLTKTDTALQALKTAAAAALDFAELKAAIATALADI